MLGPQAYLYLDTNIICEVATRPTTWGPLGEWLGETGAMVALSDAHLAELHEVDRKHEAIADFLCSVPACFIKNGHKVLT